jgi:hypothetical protein
MPFKQWGANELIKAADAQRFWLQQEWVIKQSDQSATSDVSVNDDTELFIALEANTEYWFETFLIYDGHLDGGLRLALSVPAGATPEWTHGGLRASAGTTVGEVSRTFITTGEGLIGCVTGSTTVVAGEGRVTTAGTAGNFRIRWAQINSHATATRILAGSGLLVTKLTT